MEEPTVIEFVLGILATYLGYKGIRWIGSFLISLLKVILLGSVIVAALILFILSRTGFQL